MRLDNDKVDVVLVRGATVNNIRRCCRRRRQGMRNFQDGRQLDVLRHVKVGFMTQFVAIANSFLAHLQELMIVVVIDQLKLGRGVTWKAFLADGG